MSQTINHRNLLKLQRAILDGLQDRKAQDIRVFDTAELTTMFERILICTGTSNRQTRAIAASVSDKVSQAGCAKPRMEGQENGEWIIIDCGAAVAHVFQPAIRQYYRLEEIWGAKPVRVRATQSKDLAAPGPAQPPGRSASAAHGASAAVKAAARTRVRAPAKKASPKQVSSKAAPAKRAS